MEKAILNVNDAWTFAFGARTLLRTTATPSRMRSVKGSGLTGCFTTTG